MPLRCVIVDDSPAVLEAASRLLASQGLIIVGSASNVEQALRAVEQLLPDVVLVDIDLGPESGLMFAHRVAELEDGTKPRCILISTHDEADYADLIAESPAEGFLSKSELSGAAVRRLLGITE